MLHATGKVEQLAISGEALVWAGAGTGWLRAGSLELYANGKVEGVSVGRLGRLVAPEAGLLWVAEDLGEVEVAGGLDGVEVAGEAWSLKAGSMGNIKVGGNLWGLSVRDTMEGNLEVGADLYDAQLGSFAGSVTVGGDLESLRAAGSLAASFDVAMDVGTIAAGKDLQASVHIGASLGEVRAEGDLSLDGSVAGTVTTVAAQGLRASVNLNAQGLNSLKTPGKLHLTLKTNGGPVGKIDVGKSLEGSLTVGSVDQIRAAEDLEVHIQASAALGSLEAGGKLEATLQAAEIHEVVTSEGGTLNVQTAGDVVGMRSAGPLKVAGTIGGGLGQLEANGGLQLELTIKGSAGSISSRESISGSFEAAAIKELITQLNLAASVRSPGRADRIQVGSDLSGHVKVRELGSLSVGKSLPGEVLVEMDANTVTVGEALSGKLHAGGNVTQLSVGGHLSGDLQVGASLGWLKVQGDATGNASVSQSLGRVQVRANYTGQLTAGGPVGSITVGETLSGTVVIDKALEELLIGWDAEQQRRSGGRIEGATVRVGGPLKSIQVFSAGDELDGAVVDAVLSIAGNLGALLADGSVGAELRVGGDVGRLAAGLQKPGDWQGSIHVEGRLGELVASRSIKGLQANAFEGVGSIRAVEDLSISLQAGADLEQMVAEQGSIQADLNIDGSVGFVQAGTNLSGHLKAKKNFAALVAGAAKGGNLSATIISEEGSVGEVIALAADPAGATEQPVQREPDLKRPSEFLELEAEGETYRLQKPPRPTPPAQGFHGDLQVKVDAHEGIGRLIAHGTGSVDATTEGALGHLYARGSLQASVQAGTGPVTVETWDSLKLSLTTSGPVDVAAFGPIELTATESGPLAVWSWDRVEATVKKAPAATVWGFGEVVAQASVNGEGLRVASLDQASVTADGAGPLNLSSWGSLTAEVRQWIGNAVLATLSDLTVTLHAYESVQLYAFGDVTLNVQEADHVDLVAWRNAQGTIHARGNGGLFVLQNAELRVSVGGNLQLESARFQGSLQSGGNVWIEAWDDFHGDITNKGILELFVHGRLEGTVRNQLGPTALDVSKHVSGNFHLEGPLKARVGSLDAQVNVSGPVDLESYENVSGQLTSGAEVWLNVLGNLQGRVEAGGALKGTIFGTADGEFHAGKDLRLVVGKNTGGKFSAGRGAQLPSNQPPQPPANLLIYAYGTLNGTLEATGTVEATALESLQAEVWSGSGPVRLSSIEQAHANVVAAGPVDISTSATLSGQVKTPADLRASAAETLTLQLEVGGAARLRSGGALRLMGQIDQSLNAKALDDGTLNLRLGGDAEVDAGGSLSFTSQGGGILLLRSGDGAEFQITGARRLDASALGAINGNVQVMEWAALAAGGAIEVGISAPILFLETADQLELQATASQTIVAQSLGDAQLNVSGHPDIHVRSGREVSGQVEARSLELAAANNVDLSFNALGNVTLSSLAGMVKAQGISLGYTWISAHGDILAQSLHAASAALKSNGKIEGQLDVRGQVNLFALGNLRAEVTAGGSAHLEVGGTVQGKINAAESLRLTAGGSVYAELQTAHGGLQARMVGSLLGPVSVGGTATIEALGAVATTLKTGPLRLRTAGPVRGTVDVDGDGFVQAGDSALGDFSSTGSLTLVLGSDFHGTAEASKLLVLSAKGSVEGSLTGQDGVHVNALKNVSGTVQASGPVEFWTWGDAELRIHAGRLFASAGGRLNLDVTALGESNIYAGAGATLTVDSGSSVHVSSLGPVALGGRVGLSTRVLSYDAASVQVQSGGPVSIWALGPITTQIETQAGTELLSARSIAGRMVASDASVVTALEDIRGEFSARGDLTLVTWGRLQDVKVSADDALRIWSYEGGTVDAVSNHGFVSAFFVGPAHVTGRAATGARVTALGDLSAHIFDTPAAQITAVGHLLATTSNVGHVHAANFGSFQGELRGVEKALIAAGGPATADVAARQQAILISWDDLTLNVHDTGTVPLVWSAGDVAGTVSARRLATINSFGKIHATIKGSGPCETSSGISSTSYQSHSTTAVSGDSAACGTIGRVIASQSIGGSLSALKAISEVRAGGPIYALIQAPYVGSVVPYDRQLAQRTPPARPEPTQALALRESLQATKTELLSQRDGMLAAVSEARSDLAASAAAAVEQASLEQALLAQLVNTKKKAVNDRLAEARHALEQAVLRATESVELSKQAVTEFVRQRQDIRDLLLAQYRAAWEQARQEAKKFRAERLEELAAERQTRAEEIQKLLELRSAIAQSRRQQWIEAVWQTLDEYLAEIQTAVSYAGWAPGPVGTISSGVNLVVSVARGDWKSTAAELLSCAAGKVRNPVTRYALLGAITYLFRDSAQDTSLENLTQRSADSKPSEPACFVAGTPILVVLEAQALQKATRPAWIEPLLDGTLALALGMLALERLSAARRKVTTPTVAMNNLQPMRRLEMRSAGNTTKLELTKLHAT